MRRGVLVLVLVALAAAFAAASARASGTTTTVTTTTTSTTTATTTTSATTTTTAPDYALLAGSPLTKRCVGAGAVAIVPPRHRTLALGTPARKLGRSTYPESKPVVTFDSAAARGRRCAAATVTLTKVSLFRGAVTATVVAATDGAGKVKGLEVYGRRVHVKRGDSVDVGNWGRLTLRATLGRFSAPLGLLIVKKHAGFPKDTVVLVAFAAAQLPLPQGTAASKPASAATAARHQAKKHKSRRKQHRVAQPLKWTPHLGVNQKFYDFPVAGGASYIDTYGANRNDIYDGWHHGDDLFAPLGTPVVAVVTGKLSLVGWNRLGGWRLWLTDKAGNSFYYAHLAGYSRWILHHRNVQAGQVVGFLGRTGDAFTTTPHLHFEIHPHQLLKLGYDGAVDPTSYLGNWRLVHVPAKAIPKPARLRAPVGTPAAEAKVVWHQLLAARHLLPARTTVDALTPRRPFPPERAAEGSTPGAPPRHVAAVRVAEHVAPPPASNGPWPLVVLALAVVASMLGAFAVGRRRRRRAST